MGKLDLPIVNAVKENLQKQYFVRTHTHKPYILNHTFLYENLFTFSCWGLHNDVDIKIVIIYKIRNFIHFSLLLKGF